MPETSFFERSKAVSQRFLQSAVVVDDLARLGNEPLNAGEQPKVVTTPGRGAKRGATKEIQADEQKDTRDVATHDLNAKRLIDAFADKGVVCAALRPQLSEAKIEKAQAMDEEEVEKDSIEEIKIRTDNATQRADIVILDWNIRPEAEAGKNAREIIKHILSTDIDTSAKAHGAKPIRRLRLIAIYTGERDLKPIVNELRDFVKSLVKPLQLSKNQGDVQVEDFTVRVGAVTIVVYGKEKGSSDVDAPDRRVDEESLPDRLVNDFATMTAGLLSNVALASLSAVRLNTHRILNRFGSHIDAPYVAHRAMMEPPEEASEHPVPLVAAEIESILADSLAIREHVGEKAIQEWLESLDGFPLGAGMKIDNEEFKELLLGLLMNGLRSHAKTNVNDTTPKAWKDLIENLIGYKQREATSILSNELTKNGVKGEEADAEFAMLTSTRSHYDEPTPYLRLGSVVAYRRGEGRWKYRLCIQPLCDSVRLKSMRPFPFLRLEVVGQSDNKPFDFVVKDRGELKRLRVSIKAHEMELVKLKPDAKKGVVLASKDGEDWFFETDIKDPPGPTHLKWISDLRTEFAHRVANMFATELSRVGLTESEWLRRMSKKYQ